MFVRTIEKFLNFQREKDSYQFSLSLRGYMGVFHPLRKIWHRYNSGKAVCFTSPTNSIKFYCTGAAVVSPFLVVLPHRCVDCHGRFESMPMRNDRELSQTPREVTARKRCSAPVGFQTFVLSWKREFKWCR